MERALILQAKQGNPDAFGMLVKDYDRRIYHAAYSFMHNMDDAADIAQEVFIRAFRHIAGFDETRPLYPWLYRITRNLCLNKLSRSDHKNVSLPEDPIASGERAIEEQLIRNYEQQKIQDLIQALPEKAREIIELKHFQDCSYAEMAEILGVPVGTVMSRLYNARMKLKEILLKEEATHGMQ